MSGYDWKQNGTWGYSRNTISLIVKTTLNIIFPTFTLHQKICSKICCTESEWHSKTVTKTWSLQGTEHPLGLNTLPDNSDFPKRSGYLPGGESFWKGRHIKYYEVVIPIFLHHFHPKASLEEWLSDWSEIYKLHGEYCGRNVWLQRVHSVAAALLDKLNGYYGYIVYTFFRTIARKGADICPLSSKNLHGYVVSQSRTNVQYSENVGIV